MISSINSTIAAKSMMHSTSLPARCVFSARTSWRTPVFLFFVLFLSAFLRLLFQLSPKQTNKKKPLTVVHLRGHLLDVDVDPVEDAPLLDDEDALL